MKKRAASGIVLGALTVFVVFSKAFALLLFLVILGVLSLAEWRRLLPGNRVGVSAGLMLMLIPAAVTCAFLMRIMPLGSWRLLLTVTATALCDTFAYLIGNRWGKHPLALAISPGKTVEGTAAGIAAALTVVIGLGGFAGIPFSHRIGLGFLIGAGAVAGDLFESSLKRRAGMKDSGGLLPGHGGILDRLDSHFATLILAYGYYFLTGSLAK